MNDSQQKQLGATLWGIADKLRGAMNADDFRDYMLSFLFLRYLSDNYEEAAKKELGSDYVKCEEEIKKIYATYKQDEKIDILKEQVSEYFHKQQLEEQEKEMMIDEHQAFLESRKLTPLVLWYSNNLDQLTTF